MLLPFGKYTVLEKLGQGSMGVVYKATDGDGHYFAIKVLKDISEQNPVRKRFFREIEICSHLLHPNIAIPIDFVMEPIPFIVFEYLQGWPLAAIMARGALLDDASVTTIIEQIADGLSYVHEMGVVHGDLNPGNNPERFRSIVGWLRL